MTKTAPSISFVTTPAMSPVSKTNNPMMVIRIAAVFDIGLALTANC